MTGEMAGIPTRNIFGLTIKAARTGFHYSDKSRAYVRLRPHDTRKDHYHLEICPPKDLSRKARAKDFIVWWEGDLEEAVEGILPVNVSEYQEFTLDGEGRKIK